MEVEKKNDAMPQIINPNNKTLLNISSFQVIIMFRRGLFYSYLSIYLRNFIGLSVTETTFYATFPMIINVVFQTFIWGNLSDRLQLRRTLIIAGELIASAITSLIWYFHILPSNLKTAGYVLIIGMTVVEIFWSMSNVAWSALISDLYPENQRTGLQGRMASIGAVGRFIGIIIGGLLYDGLSYYYDGWGFHSGLLFFIASGIMIVSTIPMFFVPEGGIKLYEADEKSNNNSLALNGDMQKSMAKKFTVFLIAMVFINFGINSITLLKSQYLTLGDGFNVSSRLLSYILGTGTAAIFAGGLIINPLAKKLHDEALLIAGSLIAFLYLLGYVFSVNLATIFVSDFLGGAAMVIVMASSYSYASRMIPAKKRGRQFALFNAASFLSWGLPSTIVTGPLVDHLLSMGMAQTLAYKLAFLTAAAMVVVGAVVLIFTFRMIAEKQAKYVPLVILGDDRQPLI